MINNIFITFIIPTIGRNTLYNSIKSLINQDDDNWNAIIIFDGIKKIDFINLINNDNKIKCIEIDKIEGKNSAGLVRNIGLNYCFNSEWIGFLDDDDTISTDYISKLKHEIYLNPKMDVCVFRMAYSNGCILPNKSVKNIEICKIGISFAIKREISEEVKFQNNLCEDYFYLKELQNKNYKIILSSYTTYFVRTEPFKCTIYPKILINF